MRHPHPTKVYDHTWSGGQVRTIRANQSEIILKRDALIAKASYSEVTSNKRRQQERAVKTRPDRRTQRSRHSHRANREETDMLENHYQIRIELEHRRRDVVHAIERGHAASSKQPRGISLPALLALGTVAALVGTLLNALSFAG